MRASQPDGHRLRGDARSLSPAVLRGQQKILFGLTADVETGQKLLSGSKKVSTLSKQTVLGTNNSAKYKLGRAPKGQHGALHAS